MNPSLRPSRAALLVAAALLFAGASVTPASAAPKPGARVTPADRLAGNWQGTWTSVSGHHGKLLCKLTPVDSRHLHAHFTAYWLAFHGGYDVELNAKRSGPAWSISGEKDLGAIYGGVYHYKGTIGPGSFEVSYTAHADHGTFLLKRP